MGTPQLWKHQQDGIDRARDACEFALFYDMGCGKTRTTIEILRAKFNENERVLRTLILCPIIVMKNWKDEFLKFSKIKPSEITILYGDRKKRLEQISKAKGNIFILNYEGLLITPVFEAVQELGIEILVCDESHKLKNHSTERTKRAIEIADKTKFRYLLTGTPILNSPMDIFSQFRVLDGGATFGKNFYSFRATFFYDKNAHMPKQRHFPNWVVKPKSLDQMNEMIYRKAMRVKKEDCLDLPPLIRQVIEVEMSEEQARLYNEMKKDFITFVQNLGNVEAVTADLAITKGLRLMQIVSGTLKTEEKSVINLKNTPKLLTLKELLEEITPTSKVLVWAVFQENFNQIREVCEELKIGHVEIHGQVSHADKMHAVDKLNNDDSTRVLIGHPGSGGVGVNLVGASYSIYYSRGFSLENDLQSEARNWRGGSEIHEKITRIDLVCKQTIDEIVLKALASKQEIGEHLLRAIALEL